MVTIIIASENTKEALNLCLLSIRKYTKAPYRVLVVDNSSTDGSLKLLEQFPWVKITRISGGKIGERHGRALEAGAQKVRTKYFLTLDSDVEILDFNWLNDMLKKITGSDAAFVGEVVPKQKTKYFGDFRERALPYCLLIKTDFFKKNNCTFVPQYYSGNKEYQKDVGTDILLKAQNLNHSYGSVDQSIKDKVFHYGGLTAVNLFETEEWKAEFESHLNNGPKLNASQKQGFRKYISQLKKIIKEKIDLINHRVNLIKGESKTNPHFTKNHKQIKQTLNDLSAQLYRIGDNYFKSENHEASISKLKEAQHYADLDLTYQIMVKLALTYTKTKMPQKTGRVLSALINLKPKKNEVLYSIGSIYKANNDFDNATTFYDKVIHTRLNREDELCAGAYYHLGEIAFKSGQTSKAKDCFSLCLKINPAHKKASYYLANISQNALPE